MLDIIEQMLYNIKHRQGIAEYRKKGEQNRRKEAKPWTQNRRKNCSSYWNRL